MNVSRRKILGVVTGGAAGVGLVATLPGLKQITLGQSSRTSLRKRVQLVPVPGVKYRKRALDFMATARFKDPRSAIYGMRDPNVPFLIKVLEEET